MGLLDYMNQPDNALFTGLLAAAGPSRAPVSFGQALMGGAQYANQVRQQQLDEQGAQQMLKLRDAQMQEYQSQADERRQKMGHAKALEEAIKGFSPMAGISGPTVDNVAKIPQMDDPYSQSMALAQHLQAKGFGTDALAMMEKAQKLKPKFDQTPRVGVKDGQPITYVLDESGNPKIIDGVLPRDEMKLADTGSGLQAYNSYALQPGQRFQKTATPGELMQDRRSRDANAIAAQGNVVNLSTGLRKEFDDLPEVKAYKAAEPAYTSILDASKRNNPQSDINIVYGVAKIYDPNSAVREGEYGTVANSPNIPDKIKGWAQYVSGGGRLTPEVKAQMVREAEGRMRSLEQPYLRARSGYEDIANRSGGNPTLVFPSKYQSPIAPAKTISLADIAATAKASGKTTREVTEAAKKAGYTIGGM